MSVFCIIIDTITLLSIATHYSNCYREVIDVTVVSCNDPVFRVAFNTAFMTENQLLLSAENDVTYAVGLFYKKKCCICIRIAGLVRICLPNEAGAHLRMQYATHACTCCSFRVQL